MTILAPIASDRNANPAAPANPRDSWPNWTDEDRWEPIPEPDDYRPPAGPDFTPTPEEEAEAVELLNNAGVPGLPDPNWDAKAEDAFAMDRVAAGPIF